MRMAQNIHITTFNVQEVVKRLKEIKIKYLLTIPNTIHLNKILNTHYFKQKSQF